MATTQVHLGKTETTGNAPSSALTTWAGLAVGSPHFATTEVRGTVVWPVAGVFANLLITGVVAPGAGKSWTFTVRKNGVDTALTVTISDTATSARDSTHTVSVAAGDSVTLQAVPSGSPTAISLVTVAVEFTSTGTGESGYAGQPTSTAIVATAARYQGVFRMNLLFAATTATSGAARSLAAAAGTITALYAFLDGTPGAGKNYTFSIYKNGVRQDGTAGTPDTRVVVADSATTGATTAFSLGVAAGDVLTLESLPTGTPTARRVGASVRFVATTDGQSQFCGCSDAAPSASATQYTRMPYAGSNAWTATESDETLSRVVSGISTFTLAGLRVRVDTAPGTGKSLTYSVRKNAASPAGIPSVPIADTATSGTDATGTVSLADGDTLNLRAVPAGTPTLPGAMLWGLIQTMGGAAPAAVETVQPFVILPC